MSRTHAGGVTRETIRTEHDRRHVEPPAPTPPAEWDPTGRGRGRTWGENDKRARWRRIARRRARKGYAYEDAKHL